MKDLPAIVTLYGITDASLQKLWDEAGSDDPETRARIEHSRAINDQGCFLLAWGQLEADIHEACREAIRAGRRHVDWRIRRAWTLYNPDDPRLSGLSFPNRLRLVLETGSPGWARAMRHYGMRNEIAHGNLRSDRMDIPRAIREFHEIQGLLERG